MKSSVNVSGEKAIASFVYNRLVDCAVLADTWYAGRIWNSLWRRSCRRFHGPVFTMIHGHHVMVNYGYTYPMFTRRFQSLNNPLVEVAHQTFVWKKKPITIIDVGAAVGDTALLLKANLGQEIGQFHCVEGDSEFLVYLNHNLKQISGVTIHSCLLSSRSGTVPELIRTHLGTASAQGERQVPCIRLDEVIYEPVDMIKVDVDGFDGEVLIGAENIIRKFKPPVIFEWHPVLCEQTRNDWRVAFQVLAENDYDRFVWFTKFGYFSHFMAPYESRSVELLAEYCLSNPLIDSHYDVVALPRGAQLNEQSIAHLHYARNRKSKY